MARMRKRRRLIRRYVRDEEPLERRPIAKYIFIGFLLLLSGITGAVCGTLYSYITHLPSLAPLEYKGQDYWSLPTKIYSADGELIGEFSKEKRRLVKIEEIPQCVIDAFVAVEDADFFSHFGVNIKGIIRAALVNLTSGRIKEGGSSITQQLAKNLFLTNEKSLKRKIEEIALSLKIERRYSKLQILERYLNKIYFGKGVYGIERASLLYFRKPAKELLLHEAAMLAGIPRSPVQYSPFANPKKALSRQRWVLHRMVKEGYITKEEADSAYLKMRDELSKMKERSYVVETTVNRSPYFVEYVRTQLERDYGWNLVYQGGLEVTTTLNLKMQKAAEDVLFSHLKRLNKHRKEKVEGALLAICPKTGEIKAMVGGSGFTPANQLNRAYQAKRQPGSAFKPIIYAAAIDSGFTLSDTVVDEPVAYPNIGEDGGTWTPQNYEDRFYGEVTLRKALEQSINVATIKVLEEIGPARCVQYAHQFGISSVIRPYLSLALGSSEVSLMEMVTAFCVFANSGIKTKPYAIKMIKDRNGKVLEETVPFYEPVLSPETAYIITSALSGVIERGTAHPVLRGVFSQDIAGKTGTTDEFVDAWFIGYTPELCCGIWIGYDEGRKSLGRKQSGCVVAAPVFRDFMKEALKLLPKTRFTPPDNITFCMIDRNTGLLATDACENQFYEVFIAGTEPKEYCEDCRKFDKLKFEEWNF